MELSKEDKKLAKDIIRRGILHRPKTCHPSPTKRNKQST